MLKDTVQLTKICIMSHVNAQSVFQPWKDGNKKSLETMSRNVTFRLPQNKHIQ